MRSTAEVLPLRPPQAAEPSGAAMLHELRVVRALLTTIEHRLLGELTPPEKPTQQTAPLSDDAIVDQRTAPAPKDLYLRLARSGAFPSNKIGKRIVARWGDVRVAFLGGPAVHRAAPEADAETSNSGDLDALRRELGLVEKG